MPSLLAILLVVRSRPGPQVVYCYPPNPQRQAWSGQKKDDDASDSDSDADINGIASLRRTNSRTHKVKPSQESAQTTVDTGEKYPPDTPPGTILGFSEDSLERLLAPGLWSDRKQFEVCLDGVKFIGHPIHAYEEGKWTRKDTRGAPVKARAPSELDERYGDYTNFGITVTEPLSPVRTARDFVRAPESVESQFAASLGTSMATSASASSSTETAVAAQIEMFNVVFVFDSAAEVEDEVEEVYQHVVKKLGKALHYCQKQSGYVGAETRRITSLRARAKQDRVPGDVLQQQILEASELAWAINEVFDAISAGRIAGIRLNGQAISLHVPQGDSSPTKVGLEPSSGLVLLEDKGTLLRELSHPDASPLAHFIREHTPTKSLSKLAARMGMSVDEVLFLARHLTKWRKARSFMALHPRNTYIVQPNAPTERLSRYNNDYARQFPGLPSLPQMLKFLGGNGKPIRYGMLIPSRDHRTPYMEILAWLVRHEFVAQLKTFGWLRRISRRKKTSPDRKNEVVAVPSNQNRVPLSVTSLLSPQLRAVDDDDRLSVSSERTAIPLRSASTPRSRTPLPQEINPEEPEKNESEDDPWNIILDPFEDPNGVTNVQHAIEETELADRLPSLLKYFTGEEALEGIVAREGIKREAVERWMDLLQREGLVTTFRHL